MKTHITQKAIGQCAAEFGIADKSAKGASGLVYEYWTGKRNGIVEAFAFCTGQTWVEAEMMLIKRSENL